MGNCYSTQNEYRNEDLKKYEDLQDSIDKQEEIPPVRLDELSNSEDPSKSLLEILTEERVQQLIADFNDREANFDTSKKTKVKKKELKTFKTPFEFYFKRETEKDENDKKFYIFNMLFKVKGVFNDEASSLFEMNMTEDKIQRIDSDIKSFKVLRTEVSEDQNTVIVVIQMQTKKIAMIDGKDMLTCVVFRRTASGNYWVVAESLSRNNLGNLEAFERVREGFKNESEIFLRGTRFGPMNGEDGVKMVNRGNFNTSVGPIILKPVLGKKFPGFFNKQIKEKVNFFLTEHAMEDLVWFSSDAQEKQSIFDNQRKSFLKMMNEFPEMFDEEWTTKLNELNEKYNLSQPKVSKHEP